MPEIARLAQHARAGHARVDEGLTAAGRERASAKLVEGGFGA